MEASNFCAIWNRIRGGSADAVGDLDADFQEWRERKSRWLCNRNGIPLDCAQADMCANASMVLVKICMPVVAGAKPPAPDEQMSFFLRGAMVKGMLNVVRKIHSRSREVSIDTVAHLPELICEHKEFDEVDLRDEFDRACRDDTDRAIKAGRNEGRSFDEIATSLGIKPPTAYERWQKIRKRVDAQRQQRADVDRERTAKNSSKERNYRLLTKPGEWFSDCKPTILPMEAPASPQPHVGRDASDAA